MCYFISCQGLLSAISQDQLLCHTVLYWVTSFQQVLCDSQSVKPIAMFNKRLGEVLPLLFRKDSPHTSWGFFDAFADPVANWHLHLARPADKRVIRLNLLACQRGRLLCFMVTEDYSAHQHPGLDTPLSRFGRTPPSLCGLECLRCWSCSCRSWTKEVLGRLKRSCCCAASALRQ